MRKREIKTLLFEKVKKVNCIPEQKLRNSSERKIRRVPVERYRDALNELISERKIVMRQNSFHRKFLQPFSEEAFSPIIPCDDKTPSLGPIEQGEANKDSLGHSNPIPTLGASEIARKVQELTQEMNLQYFFRYCSIFDVCGLLGVTRGELDKAREADLELDRAIKMWEIKRNSLFFSLSMKMAPGAWIFLAKNWLGYKEKAEVTHAGSDKLPPIKFVVIKDKKKR